jgi:7-cyano-7-deazaguanine reductase
MATDNPLGKSTPVSEHYDPDVLFAIPRQQGRRRLGLVADALPFAGEDVWHAWEVSWMGPRGKPEMRVGRLRIPCTSPHLLESKSLKLYLNSLNQTVFANQDEVSRVITADLSSTADAPVQVELLALDSELLNIGVVPGFCLDGLDPAKVPQQPDPGLLQVAQEEVEEVVYSHLLRSLCPVTAQPDWATLIVRYSGKKILPQELLAYILSYRRHQEFHEQCVERIFCDLFARTRPRRLSVQALYTRRGGLDINPFRSLDENSAPCTRSARQ